MHFLGPEGDPGHVLYCVKAQLMIHKEQWVEFAVLHHE